jgi:hypothetical protein
MARKPIKPSVLHALFAKSGNTCAFPGCTHPLVERETIFVAQVCHIEAAEPGGPRFNPSQTDDERRAYENLVLMCYRHHKVTDEVSDFSVERMRDMKRAHEGANSSSQFKVGDRIIKVISQEMETYWAAIALEHSLHHVADDFKIAIDTNKVYAALVVQLHSAFDDLARSADRLAADPLYDDAVQFLRRLGFDTQRIEEEPYYSNPFINRNWETLNLSIRNSIAVASVLVDQMHVLHAAEFLKSHPEDAAARDELESLKRRFQILAKTAGIAD